MHPLLQARFLTGFAIAFGVCGCVFLLAVVYLPPAQNNAQVRPASDPVIQPITVVPLLYRIEQLPFEERWPSAESQTVPLSVDVGQDVPRDDAVAANPRQSVASNARVAEKHAKLRAAHAELHDPVCGAKGRRYYGDHHYWYWRCRR